MTLANAVVQGVLLGGLYALFAAGLSLMFGVMRLVNLAHGDIAVVAAFAALLVVQNGPGTDGLHPGAALIVVVPLAAVAGYLVQRGLLTRTVGPSPLPALLVTFGLAIVLQNVLLLGFSADQQRLPAGDLAQRSITLGGLTVGVLPAIIFATAVVVLGALSLLLARTGLGRVIRATRDDPDAVPLMGVNPRHVYGIATAIAFASVAVAGVAFGTSTTFAPASGATLLIFAFEAVIIGGLGRLWGTLASGVVLGVSQTVAAALLGPAWQILAGHLVFLLVLALRPQGILGGRASRGLVPA
ncbi:MAG: branched-chain amino acid ABC transporter permease [Kineosporiaceae bacterium]